MGEGQERLRHGGRVLLGEQVSPRGVQESAGGNVLEPLGLAATRDERVPLAARVDDGEGKVVALGLEGAHPALGTVTLRQLLATWVVHDLAHLRQIARVMAKQYADEVGPWKAYLRVLEE